ncbi:DUF3397 domain-containing protein [Paenibacillus ginsengarvi]|uniref:DUF3397 domain-containing protein n=1 Tax=Paenibacillus ginsengarvi TaxID=400777 RepID=A0A3B0CSP9_9BACL|nr:DUF3397 domain-containing protein [Paenibacillus ginsengarvi]RKN86910.1 DUF3397 domain-containing protein [Paenibacillus ginsengarvi]
MNGFVNVLIHIYAFSAAVPFLWFFVLWIGVYLWSRDGKRATKLAMDVTTLLLIGSVSVLFENLFGSRFGFFLILLFFLIGYGLLGNFQYKVKGKIDNRRIIRLLWRFGFLTLSVVYLVFLFIGLGKSILSV